MRTGTVATGIIWATGATGVVVVVVVVDSLPFMVVVVVVVVAAMSMTGQIDKRATRIDLLEGVVRHQATRILHLTEHLMADLVSVERSAPNAHVVDQPVKTGSRTRDPTKP